MHIRNVTSRILIRSLILFSIPIGCGGAREEYEVVSRPQAPAPEPVQQEASFPNATLQELQTCIEHRANLKLESSHTLQYNVMVNERGEVLKVKLGETTLQDMDIEKCFRQVIAAMTFSKDTLRLRSSGPISGGERMQRELLGSSEAENPLVFLGPIIVETGGAKVLVDMGLMILAGVVAIANALEEDDPEQVCQDRYMDCLLTDMGGRRGHKFDHSRCQWCREACIRGKGVWPSITDGATRKSCEYWRRGK